MTNLTMSSSQPVTLVAAKPAPSVERLCTTAARVCSELELAEEAFSRLTARHRQRVALIRQLTSQGAAEHEEELDALILEADSILQQMREVAAPYIELAERKGNA